MEILLIISDIYIIYSIHSVGIYLIWYTYTMLLTPGVEGYRQGLLACMIGGLLFLLDFSSR